MVQKQQAVELLENAPARLVDGADHELAIRRKPLEQPDRVFRHLAVQPAGRLIHEQDARVGHQLGSDRHALALASRYTADVLAADRRIAAVGEHELSEEFVHDLVQALLAGGLRESQQSAVVEGLRGRERRQEDVGLRDGAAERREGLGDAVAVERQGGISAGGEHGEERGLAGTRRSHERAELTGAKGGVDAVQDRFLSPAAQAAALDRD
mmetsp:Transcript_9235/g.23542  ORF Transcript_9235/g.23542 Transcript_9235/m.23542 type:complete len:211 (+) Transcript_9235:1156-1788(+)